jgi:ribonuclease P protein subunit RPR2
MKNMTRKRRISKTEQKKIASRRINRLFEIAEETALTGELDLSNRYVEIARKISMKNLTRIPRIYKRRFCKYCYNYLLPTKTCRFRISRGKVIVYCLNCRRYNRIPIKKKI